MYSEHDFRVGRKLERSWKKSEKIGKSRKEFGTLLGERSLIANREKPSL